MNLEFILPLLWYMIIGFAIIMYVILDGYSQGIGILLPFAHNKHERCMMMSVILPTWDGNQTWLVFGTAALYGAFPLAFATLMPMLYLPIMTMVIAILFRGVAFEYRMKSKNHSHLWDRVIAVSSFIAAFIQGNILGAFVEGFNHQELLKDAFAWHTSFAYLTGFGVVCGYALLGSTRLILKLEGRIQKHMYQIAKICLILVAIAMAAVSICTPFVDPTLIKFWFNIDNFLFLAPLPFFTACIFGWCWYELNTQKHDRYPYFLSYLMFIGGYIGLGISTFPYLVPRTITLWEAASPVHSLLFVSVGAVIILPMLLVYTTYAYIVFKGKVKDVIKY
ncbi:MAG: cytochrome d ubiquinol oxidase subunit II [Pseudomonadota bacterium]|nr:cytochrome d ubiquinol oxidase subunit II [Pseudomonadota bacterium]